MHSRHTNMKNILITGASQGIGAATALAYARQGCRMVITWYDDAEKGRAVSEQCKAEGAEDVRLIHLDVMDNNSIMSAISAAVDFYDHIDVLINNAGIAHWKPLAEQTLEDTEQQIRTNLEGLVKMTQACLPHVTSTIVNIGSGAGMTGYADLASYCATKFGVRGFTQALQAEYPDLNIITVNPGSTATRMTNFQGTPPDFVAQVIRKASTGEYKPDENRDVNVWDYAH